VKKPVCDTVRREWESVIKQAGKTNRDQVNILKEKFASNLVEILHWPQNQ